MRVSALAKALVWIALFGLSPAIAAGAQQQPTEAQASSAPPPQAPKPIELSEIPRRAEDASVRLSEIEAGLSRTPEVTSIAEQLPSWTRRLNDAQTSAAGHPLSELSLRDLNESRNEWLGMQAQLDRWLGQLEARTSQLDANLKEVRDLGRVWSLTRQQTAGDVPAGVREAISRVMTRVGRVERAAQDRLNAVLTLQNTLGEKATSVRAELDEIEALEGDVRKSLTSADAPPLWAVFQPTEERPGLAREALDSLSRTWTLIRQYVVASPGRLSVQFLAFLALLWLFVELHKRGRRWREREGLEASVRVLSHPVANALLITLLLSRLFHPTAPLGVYDSIRLLLLVPLLMILPSLVYPTMRVPLYGLAALYVGDLAVDLLPNQALVTRVMQLALAGTTLVGLVHLARPGGVAARLDLGKWWQAAITAARVGILLLAVAVVANVFGRVRLSSLLTDSVLTGAFAAVVLFAGTLVLQGLWTLLLEARPLTLLQSVHSKVDVLRHRGIRLLRLLAVTSWMVLILRTLQLLDPVLNALRAIFGATLSVGALEISTGMVLTFFITIYLTFVVSRVAHHVLEKDVLPRFDLPRGVPGAVSMLAHYAIVLVGILFALAAAGIELSRFALLAGALGVGIGFGLQNIVNNFISGLILLFERPIQVGDTIEIESLFGKVLRIGIRSSTVRTFEGAEVIVPNAHLIDSKVVNWTLSVASR
jgi:potassium efflux system protein